MRGYPSKQQVVEGSCWCWLNDKKPIKNHEEPRMWGNRDEMRINRKPKQAKTNGLHENLLQKHLAMSWDILAAIREAEAPIKLASSMVLALHLQCDGWQFGGTRSTGRVEVFSDLVQKGSTKTFSPVFGLDSQNVDMPSEDTGLWFLQLASYSTNNLMIRIDSN